MASWPVPGNEFRIFIGHVDKRLHGDLEPGNRATVIEIDVREDPSENDIARGNYVSLANRIAASPSV